MAFWAKRKKMIGSLFVAAALLLAYGFDLFSYMEHKAQDALFQNPVSVDAPEIYVIGIDEQALAEFGRFGGWSRQIMADAINILNSDEDYKPAVIAVDIFYIEESNDTEADLNLAAAAENGGNVVLVANSVIRQDMGLRAVIDHIETPYPALAAHTAYGLANAITDSDNYIRRATLKAPYRNDYVYSFPYEVYKAYTGDELDFAETHGTAYIAYSQKPGGYYTMSLAEIFAEDFQPDFFADCIVFIGPYAPGMMDAYYTPVSNRVQMYGVEIHANVTQMLLDENFKTELPVIVNWLILFFIIALAAALSEKADIRVFLGIMAALSAGYVFTALWLFGVGYIAPVLYPVVTLVVLYLYHLIYGYVIERLEKQEVKRAFKKYVDPNLVDKLMETGEAHSNEVGVKKDVAVLFVDVRGFTPMTEALQDEPELVVKILNEYLELTASSVFNNGGSVDKFIGDATMALFNGFVPLDDYIYKAVKAAWDMVQGAADVNASIKEKYGVDVGFGVGLHCGTAIVGNLGPAFRKDYTAIGDTVNTAARLESNALPSQVLISKPVYDAVKDKVTARSVGEIPLKGKNVRVEVFSVEDLSK